jgi:AcrR family transcriptional regulator
MKKNAEIKPRIKEVARNLFFTKGYNSVTTDDLAYELGTSKRTIYEHFKSKEEILDEVVNDMKTHMDTEFDLLLTRNVPFTQMMKDVFALTGQVSGYFRPALLEDIRRYAPAVYQKINLIRKESLQDKIRKMFEIGTQEGIYRNDMNPDFLIFVFSAVFERIATTDAFSTMPITVGEAQAMFARLIFEGMYSKDFRSKMNL